MLSRTARLLATGLAAALLFAAAAAAPLAATQDQGVNFHDAIGSWFGRAIPQNTICPAGSPGCPVPPEIVMIFTVNADGTFIGIDSNIFAGGNHTTAHGQWERKGPKRIKAESTLLKPSPAGLFTAGFKNLFNATVINPDERPGRIDAHPYTYTTRTGAPIAAADASP